MAHATKRCMKAGSPTEIDLEKVAALVVSPADMECAFADVKPAFGAEEDTFDEREDAVGAPAAF